MLASGSRLEAISYVFTFTQLGNIGRFGNQLFQIASTVGLSNWSGHKYIFPKWEHAQHFRNPIPQTTDPLIPDLLISQTVGGARLFRIDVNPEILIGLHGYFQSEKFFNHCADEVREYFAPTEPLAESIRELYARYLGNGPTCAIVVRRGDYAKYPLHHPMQPKGFYQKAMDMFSEETTFLVTSDDITWCKANLTARKIVFLPQDKWIQNFFVGVICTNVITSNTSFGWWIAWLNRGPAKRVVAPKEWFGPAYDGWDNSDLLPPSWATI